MLKIDNLHAAVDVRAILKAISLALGPGEVSAIMSLDCIRLILTAEA